jgi:prevent-host-death family protein
MSDDAINIRQLRMRLRKVMERVAATGAATTIVRNGQPVAVIVGYADWQARPEAGDTASSAELIAARRQIAELQARIADLEQRLAQAERPSLPSTGRHGWGTPLVTDRSAACESAQPATDLAGAFSYYLGDSLPPAQIPSQKGPNL